MTSQKPKFTDGEKVLCFHGPLIYEAKTLKSMVTKDKQVKYFVHYAGWNKNWDEWVPENRVLKYNDGNVTRQQELFKQHKSMSSKGRKSIAKTKKTETSASKDAGTTASTGSTGVSGNESRASSPVKESVSGVPVSSGRTNRGKQSATAAPTETNSKDDSAKEEPDSKKKRGRVGSSDKGSAGGGGGNSTPVSTASSVAGDPPAAAVEADDSFLAKTEVKIKIPEELKQCLADDWDAITRQHKLLDIPAKISVQDIVDQYIAHKKANKTVNSTKEFAINDVLNGIVEYFNVMLGSQLLYKFERSQYAEILQQHPDIPLSKLYGSFHLLRLFVKLGSMLSFSALDEKSMQLLLGHLHDFLRFLVKNSSTYFNMTNFSNVSLDYHRNTQ